MGNVLLIKCKSQYDAMRNYIDEIETGFRLAGYNTYICDAFYDESAWFQFAELKKSVNIDMVFTCNATADYIRDLYPEAYYVTYLCDHPAAHYDRLMGMDDRCMVFCLDERHVQYIQKYCKNIQYVFFVPLSGSYIKKYIPYAERTREVVFTGSYQKPEVILEEIHNIKEPFKCFVEYMVNEIEQNPDLDLESSLQNALEHFQVPVSDQEFHELASDFYKVNLYARIYYRDKVIAALLEHGIKIHVFGNGWENYDRAGKENLIIEKGSAYIARKAVADAKISLNIMPWFKAGFQERIATAMLSQTVAITDGSSYIQENFQDGEELVLYSLKELDRLPEKVKWLLEHETESEHIADAGKKRADMDMTWQHRTFEMIQYIQKYFHINPEHSEAYGNILRIKYSRFYDRQLAGDILRGINEIVQQIAEIEAFSQLELCDIEVLFSRFLYLFIRAKDNFPELDMSEYTYEYLSNLTQENLYIGKELLLGECRKLSDAFLNAECDFLRKQIDKARNQIQELNHGPNAYMHEMILQKVKDRYAGSKDFYIQEILKNIEQQGFIQAYNQDFTMDYSEISKELEISVFWDEDAGMFYMLWNGKRMYYPKAYTKSMVISSVNFVRLEQDIRSPHRYTDENFFVPDDAIVVDAGVAEGNFALDVVERAKKVYLVECEQKWVEALKKTFEPWKDKVVIVEKKLGNRDDEEYATIDKIVEEGYADFIKMDVEGAETSSLEGAFYVLNNSKHLKCAICAYHKKNAEKDIRHILESHHMFTSTTNGYMFFKYDIESWIDGELRHGLVRGVK